ncbi:amidase family protein [Falsiroseomonas selenitidurans]|uniref:amidase family protein n=1 Tax=Falsiroseomonas selenitidurans TaxID=2716335 RepID=UPI001ADE8B98|nr:amidase family protein [Falsiroseomonas selenitidurans]
MIALLPLAQQQEAIAAGRITPEGLLAATLDRARRFAEFRAYAALASPTAFAPGPLTGAVLAVKGNIPVAGLPHTEGSAAFRGRIARADADAVARLRGAGAVVAGMATLSELAMYAAENPVEPMGLNPWDPARTAGGSSTGCGVAVALGLASLGLGTDSGGSVRNPALHGGVVGFKPSLGAWGYGGVPVYAPSLDTLGLIGRRVDCVARGAAVLGTAEAPAAPCLLVPQALVDGACDAPTRALFAAALARLREAGMALVVAAVPGWAAADAACGVISLAEGGAALGRLPGDAPIGAHLRARIMAAARLPGPARPGRRRSAPRHGRWIAPPFPACWSRRAPMPAGRRPPGCGRPWPRRGRKPAPRMPRRRWRWAAT